MKTINSLFILLLLAAPAGVYASQCASGEVMTREAYQYGRFETRMQSTDGDGVVSSFFLYNMDLGCNWPDENNELDIEMTGNRDGSVQFTTHYPGPKGYTRVVPMPFNPHAGLHDYAFEWEPGIVRWFVDGQLAFTQNEPFVDGLIYPMRILMNLWGVDSPNWAGIFDPTVMPASARYEYVRYYAFTPGSGEAGTGNNFTLQWSDEFDGQLDQNRWEAREFAGFGGNHCTFVSNNVSLIDGQLQLEMTAPLTTTYSQVHFSVDASSLAMGPADVVNLNGSFNNWCGSCNPMSDSDGDGIWELTLTLAAGEYEYLYSTNGWSGEIGGPVQGSSCDFKPCDQYTNYGVVVPYDSAEIQAETFCWGSCDSCADADSDGIPDTVDNCTTEPNPLQKNNDADALGDACDIDDDNDGLSDIQEMNFDGVPSYDPLTDTDPFKADTDDDGLSDADEINYDGLPAYNPLTDTNPLSANTDSDAYTDGMDPVPLNYNFDDGDVAPWGSPDGLVNVGDMLICTQLMLGLKTPTADNLAHGDLYPVGMPDGVIGLPDYVQLLKLIFEQ